MNRTEHFQNNNENLNNNSNTSKTDPMEYTQLKTNVATLVNVGEDRLQDFKVSGESPEVEISFTILPRSIDHMDEKNLEELKDSLSKMKNNMNYVLDVDGQTLKFIDINVSSIDKATQTQHEKLLSQFVDPQLNTQIQHLKDIKSHVTYDNNTDRFFKFDEKTSDIYLPEKQNNIPLNAETGILDGDETDNNTPPIEQFTNVPYYRQFW